MGNSVSSGPSGSLLVVCTANVCRSPLAEEILADALPNASVSSAGVRALVDAPMCPVSAELLPDAAAHAHSARQLTPELVAGADLVLAMERQQRSAVVRTLPGSQAKVFTLTEAAALLDGMIERGVEVPADLVGLAAALHATRGLAHPPQVEEPKRWWQRARPPEDPLTIADGHGLSDAEHRRAADRVAAAAQDIAGDLTGSQPASASRG